MMETDELIDITEGVIDVSDEVVGVCAVSATLKTPGVKRMAGGISEALTENILRKEIISKGVRVVRENDEVELDVHVIVSFGCRIPQMAWEVQENVKKEILTMTGLSVKAVNIHVQGVEADDKK